MHEDNDATVRAQRVEIVDTQGRTRIVIGEVDRAGSGGTVFGIAVLDERGRRRLQVALDLHGAAFTVGAEGDVVAELGHRDGGSDALVPGPYLVLGAE